MTPSRWGFDPCLEWWLFTCHLSRACHRFTIRGNLNRQCAGINSELLTPSRGVSPRLPIQIQGQVRFELMGERSLYSQENPVCQCGMSTPRSVPHYCYFFVVGDDLYRQFNLISVPWMTFEQHIIYLVVMSMRLDPHLQADINQFTHVLSLMKRLYYSSLTTIILF